MANEFYGRLQKEAKDYKAALQQQENWAQIVEQAQAQYEQRTADQQGTPIRELPQERRGDVRAYAGFWQFLDERDYPGVERLAGGLSGYAVGTTYGSDFGPTHRSNEPDGGPIGENRFYPTQNVYICSDGTLRVKGGDDTVGPLPLQEDGDPYVSFNEWYRSCRYESGNAEERTLYVSYETTTTIAERDGGPVTLEQRLFQIARDIIHSEIQE